MASGDAVAVATPASAATRAPALEPGTTRRWVLQIGLIASLLVWVVSWYWDTAASMAAIWWRSDTFAHGMVVYPISIWLIWRARKRLEHMSPVPAYWALVPLAALSFGWLLGELAGVQAARHFGLVAMIALIVWVMVGTQIARVIAFPLAFTLLAVPIGEFLLPLLIEQTADFTVGALRLSGIPVFREGNDFIVPTGSWSVVEACSGLRYLIASITLGLLYAYLTFTSLRKRLLFVLASILVPIVANWIRAYMIVMIGHLSGMKYAVGVDHLIYGWIFFGVVMLILFWIGSFWRDDHLRLPGDRATDERDTAGVGIATPAATLFAGILVAAVITAAPRYAEYLQSAGAGPAPSIAAPRPVNGWQRVENESLDFRPHYVGARATLDGLYERDSRRVGLHIAYYAAEHEGGEMISSRNELITKGDRKWHQVSQRTIAHPGSTPSVIETRLKAHDRELIVWHWYWAGDALQADPRLVKMQQAVNKLLRRGDDAAVVMLYVRSDGPPREGQQVLRDFAADMAAPIAEALSRARAETTAMRLTRSSTDR